MGKKRRAIFQAGFTAAALTVLVAILWKPFHLDEPWYRGKSLSGWLACYGAGPGDYKPSPEADEALRHIGTNAVPHLLRLLHTQDPPASAKSIKTGIASTPFSGTWTTTTPNLKERIMAWVEAHSLFRFHQVRAPASWKHWQAYLGFQAIGPLGWSAMPELVIMAHDTTTNSNPSGTGMVPCISFWKDTANVARFAARSSTYRLREQSRYQAPRPVISLDVVPLDFLVDGEIAAWSLAAIGSESVPPLLEMLGDPNPRVRCRAAVALGLIGPDAEPAVPALVKMLNDPDENTRWEATDAVGWIGKRPELVVPALTALLRDPPDTGTEFTAIASLGDYGERATNAIPALLGLFQNSDKRFGEYAAGALIKISRETTEKEVFPFLLSRIHNLEEPYWRSASLLTLGEATNEMNVVIPVLIEALGDNDRGVRLTSLYVLGRFGPEAGAAIPKLTELTNNPDTNISARALAALRKISIGR